MRLLSMPSELRNEKSGIMISDTGTKISDMKKTLTRRRPGKRKRART